MAFIPERIFEVRMKKTILLTGATDGIGLETATMLADKGHTLLLHGRSQEKLTQMKAKLEANHPTADITVFQADFSDLSQVRRMAQEVQGKVSSLDVLINNAGVFVVDERKPTVDGLDIRFAVNTVAPYVLTKALLPLMDETGRVVNLSSAAQAPVDLAALSSGRVLEHSQAYAQSKLALILWGLEVANLHPPGPSVLAVNPKSFLGSKMVRKAYGRQGYDLKIGGELLVNAALSPAFAQVNGQYFDNDAGVFAQPHPQAKDVEHRRRLVEILEQY